MDSVGNFFDQLPRQCQLAGSRHFRRALAVNQQQRIVVLAKGVRTNVANQQRYIFAQTLDLGVFQQVMTFGCKAYTKQPATLGCGGLGDGGQDVLIFNKRELRWLARAVFLDFLM